MRMMSCEGVHVADFCFFGMVRGEDKLASSWRTAADSLRTVFCHNTERFSKEVIRIVNNVYDSCFIMSTASFEK